MFPRSRGRLKFLKGCWQGDKKTSNQACLYVLRNEDAEPAVKPLHLQQPLLRVAELLEVNAVLVQHG